ncbi:MAG: DALR domain-containing protein, partial [Planctomycetota bacterium]
SHYRSPLDFSDAALFAALSGYGKISDAVKDVRKMAPQAPEGDLDSDVAEQLEQFKGRFEEAMNDDLNTSVALSIVFELVRLANTLLQDSKTTAGTLGAVDDLFTRLGGDVLGVVKDEYEQTARAGEVVTDKLVNILIEQRNQARKDRDFARADDLRDKLDEVGIALEDTPERTTWRMK